MKLKVGINDFVKRQIEGSGKTYAKISFSEIAKYAQSQLNKNNYKSGYRDGTILISVDKKDLVFYVSPLVKITEKTKLVANIKRRRINEDFYISIKALNGQTAKLSSVDLVLYRQDILAETNEQTTDCDWELISFHGVPEGYDNLPMGSVTMMRNQLEKTGGTKANYSSTEWAESIDFWQKYAMLDDVEN